MYGKDEAYAPQDYGSYYGPQAYYDGYYRGGDGSTERASRNGAGEVGRGRYSVYVLYWNKSTNSDAFFTEWGAAGMCMPTLRKVIGPYIIYVKCVCACVRACVCVGACACVRVCVRACAS